MAVAITAAMQNQIAQNYIAILGRNPDPLGFAFWVQTYADANGTPAALTSITNGFGNSAEFKATYAGDTTQVAVGKLYQNVLLRAADAGGLAYWTNYANGLISSGQTISNAYAQTGAQMIYNASSQGLSDAAGINARTATAVASGSAAPVTTYTLTTAAQEITGSNLVVNALVDQATAANSTLTALDSLIGSGTNNTLNVTTVGTPTTLNGAQISGFQTLNIRATANTGTIALATANVTGLTNLNTTSTGNVTVTGLNSGAAVGLTGNGLTVLGAVSATYAAAATVSTLNITGGVGPSGTTAPTVAIGGTGTTSAVVNSTGAANTIGTLNFDANTGGTITTAVTVNATTNLTTGAITGAAVTSYTLNGAGTINLSTTALAATVTTVNAAGNSGGVTVALGSSLTQTVTGGSGNDVITTGAVLTTGSVNAGSGTADVLDVGTNVAHVNTTALAAKYTNFEILRINGNMDMSLFPAFTGVQISGNAGSVITNMTAAQAANVSLRAAAGGVTFTLATATGTSDVLTINAGLGTTTAAAATIGTLVATGFETINLNANPGPTAATGNDRTSTLTAITNTSLTALNLTGTAWTLGDIASSKATTWTASSLTGNGASTPLGLTLSATGAAFAGSVVTGSSLRDTVTMNSSTGVTFNLGGGNDIFSTTTALLLPSGAATDNTVNAGDGTSDQLIFTGAATATDTTFTKVSGFETLQLAGGAVNHSLTGLGAGFLGAFANGVTVTDAATQDVTQTYTWASGLYSQNVTLTHTTDTTLATTGGNQSITTGAGNDTITLTATAVVGAVGAAGNIAISTGAGVDTIALNIGTNQILAVTGTRAVTITGGTGADIISVNATHVNQTAANLGNVGFVINAGDSTTTAYDQITGFLKANGTNISDALDFGTSNLLAYVATAASGYSASELTVTVSAVGLVTFAGTAASSLTVAQQISAVQSVVTTATGNTAFWINSGSTYVFNNDAAGDSVVQLVGQTGATALITANATTDLAIFIA